MITVRFENAENLIVSLKSLPALLRKKLAAAVEKAGYDLADYVKGMKLSGAVLKNRSGRLRRSVVSTFQDDGKTMVSTVGTKGVPYAAIHEYGGVINHPGSDKFQAFATGGKFFTNPMSIPRGATARKGGMVFTHGTKPHRIPMPQRSYLRDSLSESRDTIVRRMEEAVKNGIR